MNRSESINELATALAKAQAQMTFAKKDAANPFFKSKYADLAAVVEAIKKPLADNGLSYVQTTDITDDDVIIETVLMHASGQWLSGRMRMPVAKVNDPQALGSSMTYCRRYGLQAITGLPADDDDADAARLAKDAADKAKKAQTADHKIIANIRQCTSVDKLRDMLRAIPKEEREPYMAEVNKRHDELASLLSTQA